MPSSHTTEKSTSPRQRPHSRAGATARAAIFIMLKEDHKRIKKAFRDFEKIDAQEDAESCQTLVTQTCAELEAHATLEEELFYPAARSCLGEENLVDEAEVEHAVVRMLVDQLKNMTPGDDMYAATFKVLGENLKRHIREEENEIFLQLSHAKFNWQDLLSEMEERRKELMQEGLPESEKTEAASQSGTEKSPGKRMGKARKSNADSGEDDEDEDTEISPSEPDLEGDEK